MTRYHEQGTLTATAPYDFQKSLAFIENFEPMEGEQVVTSTSFTKAIALHGYTVAFRVSNAGKVEAPMVAYELFAEKQLPAEVCQAVVERIAFFLSLNDDLEPFYAIGKADAAFTPIIDRLYGLHHIKFLQLHEAACWAVITQHTAIPIAAAIKHALIERYGSSITVDGHTYWAFPELERLASLSVEELVVLLKNERRASYWHNVVTALSGLDEQWLRTAPYEEAESWLRSIKGIGEWSAAFLLLRAEGRTERMLLNLKPFLAIVPKVYGPDVTMAQLAQRYGDWFGYWGYYLRAGAK